MEQIWFSSDTHFGHSKSFLYEPRGFESIYQHDKAIIDNWNSVVDMDDNVYLLGDVMLNDNNYGLSCLKQLKGKIHIICGNHDSLNRKELYKSCWNVVEVCDGEFLHYKKYNFYLSHYPCLCGNWDEDKPLKAKYINLCGHSHTKDCFADMDKGLIYHCELDAHNCYPVSIDTIIQEVVNR